MAKTFRCKLVTPTASLMDEAVTYASVPAWDGLFGVLPGRAPILARLGLGELRVEPAEGSKAGTGKSFFIEGGFVQMAGDQLTVLAERATPADKLNTADAEAQLKAAYAKLVPEGADRATKAAALERERATARARLEMAKKVKAG